MKVLIDFFNPNLGSSALFAFGGWGHLALLAIMAGLLALLLVFRKRLWILRENRAFMAGMAAFILVSELFSYALKWGYGFAPWYEKFPLHLCGSMKIVLTILILAKRYDLVKHVSTWAIGAGFISFANLDLGGYSFGNFMFWHYLWGHYYLFLAPIFLFIVRDYRYEFRSFALSLLALLAWSLAVFFMNWALDANWMFTGPHNDTAVPFIPAPLMVWPLNYASYVAVAFILLALIYAILRLTQIRMDRNPDRDRLPE